MGVEKENIAFYGIKAEYGKYAESRYKDDEDPAYSLNGVELKECRKGYDWRKTPKFICISDGYCGEYSSIGICVKAYGQDRWGEDEDMNLSLTKPDITQLRRLFINYCDDNNVPYDKDSIGLHIIAHYTLKP